MSFKIEIIRDYYCGTLLVDAFLVPFWSSFDLNGEAILCILIMFLTSSSLAGQRYVFRDVRSSINDKRSNNANTVQYCIYCTITFSVFHKQITSPISLNKTANSLVGNDIKIQLCYEFKSIVNLPNNNSRRKYENNVKWIKGTLL